MKIITKLYWEQIAVVKVDDNRGGWVNIEKGVRQRCVLSPDLFSLYTQLMMNELAELDGIKIGGQSVNTIRYAKDMVLLEDTGEKLQRLMGVLKEQCRMKGLKINYSKTEVMSVTKRRERPSVNINIQGFAIN